MGKQRLDRILASQGLGSRKQVKRLVKEGRVEVGGVPARDPAMKLDPQTSEIFVDGEPLDYRCQHHVVLYKPPGVLSATRDAEETTALDLLPEEIYREDLGLAGRLDKDAEGLLLLTTDGTLAHRLTHPKWKLDKVYELELEAPITDEDVQAFAEGVAGFAPARLEPLGERRARVILREGKYHQLKRMFHAIGKPVRRIKRVALGPLVLGELEPGEARPLSEEEEAALYAAVGLEPCR